MTTRDERFAQIVKRQRRQLASIGWVMILLGAVVLLALFWNDGYGDTRIMFRGLIGGGGLLVLGIGALWRARKK